MFRQYGMYKFRVLFGYSHKERQQELHKVLHGELQRRQLDQLELRQLQLEQLEHKQLFRQSVLQRQFKQNRK